MKGFYIVAGIIAVLSFINWMVENKIEEDDDDY